MVRTRYTDIAVEPFVLHYQERRPIDWPEKFHRQGPLYVEIGFGMGEFLLRQAALHPECNFVGIEQDWKRVKKTLRRIALQKKASGEDNIRILLAEAVTAMERLFSSFSVDRIFCLFPCPWPKKAHVKHRLFSREFLRLANSRLKDRGEIHVVTDFLPYQRWILEQSSSTGFDVSPANISARFDTKYERKWSAAGQKDFFEIVFKKKDHIPIVTEEDQELRVYFTDEFDPQRFQFHDAVKKPLAVICKEFLYDPSRKKAMVHLVVSESRITQHLWVIIVPAGQGWCIAKADGQTVLPTPGVAEAIRNVYEEVRRTAKPSEKLGS